MFVHFASVQAMLKMSGRSPRESSLSEDFYGPVEGEAILTGRLKKINSQVRRTSQKQDDGHSNLLDTLCPEDKDWELAESAVEDIYRGIANVLIIENNWQGAIELNRQLHENRWNAVITVLLSTLLVFGCWRFTT